MSTTQSQIQDMDLDSSFNQATNPGAADLAKNGSDLLVPGLVQVSLISGGSLTRSIAFSYLG